MRLMKAILLAPLVCTLLFATGTDALAQKKKAKEHKAPTLVNTYWALYEMNGKSVVTPADQREVYIKLKEKKGVLEGYTGCNIITGSYKEGKESLTFDAAITERMCDDMSTEEYIMKALNGTNRYELNGQYLLLYNGSYLLAIFEAKYYDE